jgi:hypothetical protein
MSVSNIKDGVDVEIIKALGPFGGVNNIHTLNPLIILPLECF